MSKYIKRLAKLLPPLIGLLMPVALVIILAVAGYLRLAGAGWGELSYQHPDETFITTVTQDIRFEPGLANYFDSAQSPLNPVVHGHSFYVYGTLPIFIVRLAADVAENLPVRLLGRLLSALFDLGVVLLAYLIGLRLYGKATGLLAAAFSAVSVMQIQQSHFYTTDNFANFFITLAFYAAVLLASDNDQAVKAPVFYARQLLYTLLFGLAAGAAMASKFNAAAVLLTLPAALAIRLWAERRSTGNRLGVLPATLLLGLGAALTALVFRIGNPYAFTGPGFWGLSLDPAWLESMERQLEYARGNTTISWFIQWMHRSRWHSFINLTRWGLGLPLGILAWLGAVFMLWRSLRGEWRQHSLLIGWLAFYFVWNSWQYTPFMRYQLPSYPLLAVTAAWFVVILTKTNIRFAGRPISLNMAGWTAGAFVLVATAAWALAFVSIYQRPEPRISASEWILENLHPGILLRTTSDEVVVAKHSPEFVFSTDQPFITIFRLKSPGSLASVTLGRIVPRGNFDGTLILNVAVTESKYAPSLQSKSVALDQGDLLKPVSVTFENEMALEAGKPYLLLISASAPATLRGEVYANETTSDYGLPFGTVNSPIKKYLEEPLNLDVYKSDSPEKFANLLTALDNTDYIFVPTNHQYGQISRVPERYPLMNLYYRELLGCPQEMDIVKCYASAKPGTYTGRLGFELVAVFSSYPQLGFLTFNDQLAEESFTFYDHPKVMIFRKTADFNRERAATILGNVNYADITILTLRQSYNYKSTLLSPAELAKQRTGGTWHTLFDTSAPQNRHPALAVLLWYLFIALLGLGAYPITRMVFAGLADKGYPLSRLLGLLLLAWLAWLGGSTVLPYTRATISALLAGMLVFSLYLAYRHRNEIVSEFSSNKKYFLLSEVLFLLFFLLSLWIRSQNPDLWHPIKGGEKPMDFSYLNAIIKSTSFPPYDPWYAGGYINYYYFGFVMTGTPIKLLGIVPSVAYNLVIPTLFSLTGLGAFSVAWNLSGSSQGKRLLAGFVAAAGMLLLGNQVVVRMIWEGLISLGMPQTSASLPGLFEKVKYAIQGMQAWLNGASLPYRLDAWYWEASRAIGFASNEAPPITEFPLFTFLYGDLHAHMMSLPITFGALGWAISMARTKAISQAPWRAGLTIFGGALLTGALVPTNTWDAPLYLLLGALSVAYWVWIQSLDKISTRQRVGLSLGGAGIFIALAFMLFTPYRDHYHQAYTTIALWHGSKTNLSSYLTHWGLFLFVIVSWMLAEAHRHWQAGWAQLKRVRFGKEAIVILFWLGFMPVFWGVNIAPVIWTLLLWAVVMALAFPLTPEKRITLLLVAGSLLVTLFVELFVLSGDIGRMNTVFKFYLQAWTLMAVLAGTSAVWLVETWSKWKPAWRVLWTIGVIWLMAGALLYLIIGTSARVRDRMQPLAPAGLDGMAFMQTAIYDRLGTPIPLAEDYRAIRWLHENIEGSPVILEMHTDAYGLGGRISMFTGLPGVVGWQVHQKQQRPHLADKVDQRAMDVQNFYTTGNIEKAVAFLEQYQIEYIVLGRLERALTHWGGLPKFDEYEGKFWQAVYKDGETVIYKVILQQERNP